MDLRSGNMFEVLDALDLRGCIRLVFVGELLAPNAYRKDHTCIGLTLPESFVEDNREMLCEYVVFLTIKGAWDLKFSITRSRDIDHPEKFEFSEGCEAFVLSNNLTGGDHLLFKLSGKSQFDVYIFNGDDGFPKTAAAPNEAPINGSEASEPPVAREIGESSNRRQYHPAAAEGNEFSAGGLHGLFANEEPQELSDEQGEDADEHDRDHAPREEQQTHPSFFKRLTQTNLGSTSTSVTFNSLELPADFRRTYGSQLRTKVTLQGISPESPEYIVCCSWHHCGWHQENATLRLFLRHGWIDFCDANNLESDLSALALENGRGQKHTYIMTELEPENAEVDLRSENMRDVLEALICKGGIVFVKHLRPTHVPRINHTCNGLVLPRWFVEDNMESLCKSVVLVTNKAWDLRFSITRSGRMIPEVVFSGGWEFFAISNNLAQGDQLIFRFSGVSQFDVYIFYADGTPKRVVTPTESLMNRSEASELPAVKKMKFPEFRQETVVVEDSEASANGLCGNFAKEEIRELPHEQENNSSKCTDHSQREKHNLHPSFFKRLKPNTFWRSNGVPCLEIPAKFARIHSSRLQAPVKLQGFYEESPVCSVTCGWERISSKTRSPRLFLRSGWKEFSNANSLELGQELEFTLISDSYFVVRDRAPMNCSDVSELPKVKKFKSSQCRHDSLVVEDSEASTSNRLCGSFVKEEIQELPDEQEKDADECKNHSPKVHQKLHPSFFRRLTPNNIWRSNGVPCQLEVPAKFAWTYGNRLQNPVKLQGIHEESPVCTVACRWERSCTEIRSPRLFLRSGWKEFEDANSLEVGQKLEFTLMFDSFVVVRKIAS